MDCTSIITWENLLREVIRLNSAEDADCAAIAIDQDDFINGPLDCERAPILTLFAMAVPDGVVKIQYSQGPFTLPTCEEIQDLSTETLLALTMFDSDAGDTIILTVEDDPALSLDCDRECEEELLSTEEMIRRTFVKVEGLDGEWAVRIHTTTLDEPINCDLTDIGTESLVRAALVATGDGGYAWRITVDLPSAIVSGAGTSEANGTYAPAGVHNGYAWYGKVGGTVTEDPTTSNSIYFGPGYWILASPSSAFYSTSGGPTEPTPWGSTWDTEDGDDPVPTVAQA